MRGRLLMEPCECNPDANSPYKQLLADQSNVGGISVRVDEKIIGEVAVLSLKGELLDDEADITIQHKIKSLIVDGVRKVIFDMERVNRVNSRGLGILIRAANTMHQNGGEVRFAKIEGHINQIFIETRLIQIFPTFETVGRAIASYV